MSYSATEACLKYIKIVFMFDNKIWCRGVNMMWWTSSLD